MKGSTNHPKKTGLFIFGTRTGRVQGSLEIYQLVPTTRATYYHHCRYHYRRQRTSIDADTNSKTKDQTPNTRTNYTTIINYHQLSSSCWSRAMLQDTANWRRPRPRRPTVSQGFPWLWMLRSEGYLLRLSLLSRDDHWVFWEDIDDT